MVQFESNQLNVKRNAFVRMLNNFFFFDVSNTKTVNCGNAGHVGQIGTAVLMRYVFFLICRFLWKDETFAQSFKRNL